jgi:hypothetical protein
MIFTDVNTIKGDDAVGFECYTVQPDNKKPLIATQNYTSEKG